jgi:hypothetical protein
MMRLLLSSCLLLFAAVSFGQRLRYQADVDKSDTAGFIKILLPPQVVAKCSPDLGDIRLMDNQGKQIPYIIKSESPALSENKFVEFPITARRQGYDSLSHILIRNIAGSHVEELVLTIGNTGANRTISISGSYDSLQWYVIRENVPIQMTYEGKNEFVQAIRLPATNYQLYNIAINGKNLLPVNIIKAGIIQQQWKQASYQSLPVPKMSVSNRSNITYADIVFDEDYQLDRIKIAVSAPRFYRRTMSVFGGDTTDGVLIGTFTATSQEPLVFPLYFKGRHLRLRIDNQDNPPLVIDSVRGFQLNKYIVAYAEADHSYQLVFGDSLAMAPDYDLSFFADSVNKEIPTLAVSEVRKIQSQPADDGDEKRNNLLLWSIIAAVLVIMLIFTWKMLNEVKGKKTP